MTTGPRPGIGARVLLLAAQGFALGLTVAWITVPASAIFLRRYGSALLPVTYIGAAAAGAISTVLLARAVRRRPLASVAVRLLALIVAALVASWLLIAVYHKAPVSFALLVLLPITVPVGFMFIVGQAGALLDVRVMKALYPRVIAGFALGFTVGGLAAPPMLTVFGDAEHLLIAAAVAAFAFLLLVATTRHRYPAELLGLESDADDEPAVTLRSLLSNRFVVLIMGFQMLSAVESQWLDYLVYDRAGQRYPDDQDLATFISRFLAISYGADILVLLFVAGLLISRFGLRLGLTANPGVVLAIVLAIISGSVLRGSGATVVFFLVVGARVSDLVMSDAAARNSLSAAYQALPTAERQAAQANVEGLGVPLAIGFSGLVLIVLRATVGTDGLALPVLTSIVVAGWFLVSVAVYRGYRVTLLANLRQRLLDPGELPVDGPNTMAVVDRLLDSDDPRDVRLGLSAIISAKPDDLADRLEQIVTGARPAAHAEALEALTLLDPNRAARVARSQVHNADPAVRAGAFSALATVGDVSDRRSFADALIDEDDEVVVAATVAMGRLGDAAFLHDLSKRIMQLSSSPSRGRRELAARMLGGCGPGPQLDRSPLRRLLADPQPEVRIAALGAVDWSVDRDLADAVVGLLERSSCSGAAVEALVRGGEASLPWVDAGLLEGAGRPGGPGRPSGPAGPGGPRQVQLLLTRVCRSIGGPEATAVLRRHARHPDRDVGLAVIGALGSCLPQVPFEGDARLGTELVESDLRHATRVVQAMRMLSGAPSAATLCAALADELDLLRRRVLAGLALRYGAEALDRVRLQLTQRSSRDHALALEWLEVTLIDSDRAAIALLDPGLSDDARLRLLVRSFPLPTATPEQTVHDLAHDPHLHWRRPWLAACALFAATGLHERAVDPHPELRDPDHDHDHDHEGIVRETLLGLKHRAAAMAVEGP